MRTASWHIDCYFIAMQSLLERRAWRWRPARRSPGAGAWRAAVEWALLLSAGAALSWLSTGFVFGTNNNVYHLPIVGALFSLPPFADDAFIQSLRGFSSGWWMLLEGSDRSIDPVVLFGAMAALSKCLGLLGMTLIAQELGLVGRAQRAGFIGVVALMPVLQGHAFAGHGGLFMNYATHSELATGVALLMLWACLRRRFDVALALIGLVFFLNAFMAVWTVLPWAWLFVRAARSDPSLWVRQRRGLGGALAVAALLATPVILRALRSGLLGRGADTAFDYSAYLLDTYPYHFLASSLPLGQWLGLAAVVATAALGLRSIGPRAAALAHALAAFGVVYAVGVLLPLFTQAHGLLNLHLLRVSVFAHLIAGIAMGVTIVRGFASADVHRRWLASPWLLLFMWLPRVALVGTLLLPALQNLLRSSSVRARAWTKRAGIGLTLASAACAAGTTHLTQQRNEALRRSVADWSELARAIERASAPSEMVLLPYETDSWQPPDAGAGVFEYVAHRPVWADRKRGAAVLWQPAYHTEWRSRTEGLAALQSWDEKLRFAAARHIDIVVDRCEGLAAVSAPDLIARVGPLCAVRVAEGPSPPTPH